MNRLFKKIINYLIVTFMMLGLIGNIPSTAFAASNTIADGWYYIKNVNAQKYLQVKDSKAKNAQNVNISKGTKANNQKWYVKNLGNGYVTIKSALGEYMVDIANGTNKDHTNVQIYSAYSGNAQQFAIKATATKNVYTIATKVSNSKRGLDAERAKKEDGTNVIQYTLGKDKKNQQWKFEVADSDSSGGESDPSSSKNNLGSIDVYVDKLNGSANKIGSVPVRGNGFKTTTSAKDPYSPKTKQDKNTSNLSLTKSFKESNGSLGNNPLITQGFMADPTAVEYNGRLYVYGTEDVIAYDANGNVKNNSYPTHTLKVISSEDLVNWRDEGSIDVKAVTKWANNAWAPSICKKKVNGSYKFFLYFANGANGIGVLTADSPTGPWKSPRSSALVSRSTPGCSGSEVPWLFDPAVLVDDDGTGYLYFGGGTDGKDKNNPGTARVVKLGNDMVSLASNPVKMSPAGLFEDSEINKIGDTYYYSYCTNFSTSSVNKGSIYYMVSKNPMSGWQQKGQLFASTGSQFNGLGGNNHHKLIEFKGKYYILYHTIVLEKRAYGSTKGYRCVQLDQLSVNTGSKTLSAKGTYNGITNGVGNLDGRKYINASTMAWNGGLKTKYSNSQKSMVIDSINTGDWLGIKSVNFGSNAKKLTVTLASDSNEDQYKKVEVTLDKSVSNIHDLYFVFRGEGYHVAGWQFS